MGIGARCWSHLLILVMTFSFSKNSFFSRVWALYFFQLNLLFLYCWCGCKVWGREDYNLIIKSQSFNGLVSLGYGLHLCVCAFYLFIYLASFSPPLNEMKAREGYTVRPVLLLGRIRLWRVGLHYGEPSGYITKNTLVVLPSPCHSHEVIFLVSSPWERGGILGGEIHESVRTPKIFSSQDFLILKLVHTQPPTIYQNYPLNVPISLWPQWLLFLMSRPQLRLSRIWHSALPYNLSSLMFPRKVMIFSLFNIFFS